MKRFSILFGYLLCLLLSSNGIAMKVGEVKIKSKQGAPFWATIPLADLGKINLKDIHVQLATASEFALIDLPRPDFLSGLSMAVVRENQQAFIEVTSLQPIMVNAFDFLVKLKWPGGSLLREYHANLSAAATDITPLVQSQKLSVVHPKAVKPITEKIIVEKPLVSAESPEITQMLQQLTSLSAAITASAVQNKIVATQQAEILSMQQSLTSQVAEQLSQIHQLLQAQATANAVHKSTEHSETASVMNHVANLLNNSRIISLPLVLVFSFVLLIWLVFRARQRYHEKLDQQDAAAMQARVYASHKAIKQAKRELHEKQGQEEKPLFAAEDLIGTQLDLAKAYIDMGSQAEARSIIQAAIAKANPEQQKQAKKLLMEIDS